MKNRKKFQYITTTLPYVNAKPHIGFAMEIIRADVYARYKSQNGYEVFFNTGTDEHGMKILEKARKEGIDVREYVDKLSSHFRGLIDLLGIKKDIHFVRTSEEKHIKAAQAFWKKLDENGFIYKKKYQAKYCVGCESIKTDSELVHGRCPEHPNRELEYIDEENYFFRFSAFQGKLLSLYKERPDFVVPSFRLKEIKKFTERGLHDFSISRLKEKMPWGIPVPGDEEHVMYVWFDALVNYISTLGWPEEKENFEKFWVYGNPIQYAGKDNLRQQSAIWQAMLMAADLPLSDKIVVNGFITSRGQKMSKSLGNVIDPYELVEYYGTDALRYYLLRHVNNFEDSDVDYEKFHKAYTANLVNGLGNLLQRIMKMIVSYKVDIQGVEKEHSQETLSFHHRHIDEFDYNTAMNEIWKLVSDLDAFIAKEKPFKKIKENRKEAENDLRYLAKELYRIGYTLQYFLPETAQKIMDSVIKAKIPEENLFPRKEAFKKTSSK